MAFPHQSHAQMIRVLKSVLFAGSCLLWGQPAAYAQGGYRLDLTHLFVCITQNWDTPEWQKQLQNINQNQRMRLYDSLYLFSPSGKRCLMQTKTLSVALCNKVIDLSHPFFTDEKNAEGLLKDEEEQLFQGLGQVFNAQPGSPFAACLKENTADDWLPVDLQPSSAVRDILKRAQQGDVSAQIQLARMYAEGDGVVPDKEQANQWLEKAAQGGDARSQLALGTAYFYALEGKRLNYQRSTDWLKKAAAQGNTSISVEAMFILAQVYAQDEPYDGVSHQKANKPEAGHWLQQAAEGGHILAMCYLAQNYAQSFGKNVQSSLGFAKDRTKAIAWYQKGAQAGGALCMLGLADYLNTNKKSMSGSRDALAAQQWRRKADGLGKDGRTKHMVNYFPWGDLPANVGDRFKIQQQYAQQGDVNAQLAVAYRYFAGEGVAKDEGKALEWWIKAAQQGDAIGQRMAGLALIFGWGVKKDHAQGLSWLENAANQKDGEAAYQLALYYSEDELRTSIDLDQTKPRRNSQLSLKWFKAAVEDGYKLEFTHEQFKNQMTDPERIFRKNQLSKVMD